VNLFFFDFDRTLYAYDFRYRLPELSRLSGVSQYALAKSWWAAGFERRAEAGEWPAPDEYLDEFARVTGGRRLSLEEWTFARSLAMSRMEGGMRALRRASELGVACLLSNNPSPLRAALPVLAPDVVEVLGENVLVSVDLGARKPSADIFSRALARFDAVPEDAFLADDTAANVEGARAIGMHAHHLAYIDGTPQTDALYAAVERFARRNG
jgi:putative hydrolase of the HAD superfamily